ncbi:DUF695 domain-containing protein [Pseudocnuella soli]|uniref:DUF695 domain-containing protein n=1 Tax=Pseudocnuella soli TaxID=2502779 RepID=UPI00104FB62A|nr:DUF695 domain-containing protein [Pseudocnuella soli]
MDNLIKLVNENDLWSVAEGENDGTPFLLRFRPHLNDFIETKKYNKKLTIALPYISDNDSLMPTDEETELFSNIEDALVDVLENDVQAVLTFVYTGQNQKEWHWYSTDINETGKRLNDALSNFDRLPLELTAEDDPDWNEYNSVLEGADDSEYKESEDK